MTSRPRINVDVNFQADRGSFGRVRREAEEELRRVRSQYGPDANVRGNINYDPRTFGQGFSEQFRPGRAGEIIGSSLLENSIEQGMQLATSMIVDAITGVVEAVQQFRTDAKEAAERNYRLTLNERLLDQQLDKAMAAVGGQHSREDMAEDRRLTAATRRIEDRAEADSATAANMFDLWRMRNRDNWFVSTFAGMPSDYRITGELPGYHTGGIVEPKPGGQVVRVGEGSSPEAIIPLKAGMLGKPGPGTISADQGDDMIVWLRKIWLAEDEQARAGGGVSSPFGSMGELGLNLEGMFKGAEEVFDQWREKLTGSDGIFADMWGEAKAAWTSVKDWILNDPWKAISSDILEPFITSIVGTLDGLKAVWNSIILWVSETVWPALKDNVFETVKGAFMTVQDWFMNGWNAVLQFVTETIWPAIKENVFEPIKTVYMTVQDWFMNGWNAVLQFVSETIWPAIKENVFEPVKGAFMTVQDWFMDAWGAVLQLVSETVWPALKENVFEPVKGAFMTVQDWFMNGWGAILKLVSESVWKPISSAALDPLMQSFKGMLSTLKGAWDSFISKLSLPSFSLPSLPSLPGQQQEQTGPTRSPGPPATGGTDVFGNPVVPPGERMSMGGIVKARPGGTHIIAGEGGRAEAILPLGPGMLGGTSTPNVTVQIDTVYGVFDLEEMIEETVRKAIKSGSMTNDLKLAVV